MCSIQTIHLPDEFKLRKFACNKDAAMQQQHILQATHAAPGALHG
jgi:hypothetical protein